MYIVHVHAHVKPGEVDSFCKATVQNAANSVFEPGIVRFDVFQEIDDPTKFVLVEIYHAEEDTQKHKETRHYKEWRDTVADMMAEPRKGIKYRNIFPEDDTWR